MSKHDSSPEADRDGCSNGCELRATVPTQLSKEPSSFPYHPSSIVRSPHPSLRFDVYRAVQKRHAEPGAAPIDFHPHDPKVVV